MTVDRIFEYALFSQFRQLGLLFFVRSDRKSGPRSMKDRDRIFVIGPDWTALNRYEWTAVGPVRLLANTT